MDNKITYKEFIESFKLLDTKYQISNFYEEIKKSLENSGIDIKDAETTLDNHFIIEGDVELSDNQILDEIQKITKIMNEFMKLKKKFKINSYIKEGIVLRNKFLDSRHNYIFNNPKKLPKEFKKLTDLEKIQADFTGQYFIAKYLDKLLYKIQPLTIGIEYEDLDGQIKIMNAGHKDVHFYETGDVEAPLIDRMYPSTPDSFSKMVLPSINSFLLHSFYNTDTQKWEYVPIKLIIKLNDNHTGILEPENLSDLFNDEDLEGDDNFESI